MDLRIVKTKRAIKQAFLELRVNTPLEKIRVKDICDLALINKTTFYKHYRDIFALGSEIENEAVELVIDNFIAKDDIFCDPIQFITELPKALNAHREILYPLFHDNFDKLFILLEDKLKRRYSTTMQTDAENILLTFAIGGTLHTLRSLKFERNCDDEILAKKTAEILTKINEIRTL